VVECWLHEGGYFEHGYSRRDVRLEQFDIALEVLDEHIVYSLVTVISNHFRAIMMKLNRETACSGNTGSARGFSTRRLLKRLVVRSRTRDEGVRFE